MAKSKKVAKTKAPAAKRRPGPKVNPRSLRQSGALWTMRISLADLDRYRKKASAEGVDLSDVVRRLLEAWAVGATGNP